MPRITHNLSRTVEYTAWEHIVQRCTNPKDKAWKNYGARGIAICDEWRNSFESFFAHVGPRPSSRHSIDRYPNNDGNYELGNVRWSTKEEQSRNKRTNRLITFNGKTQCLTDWAKEIGVPYQVLQKRLRDGIPIDRNNNPKHRTHCPKGHPYDAANTIISKRGSRGCRACSRLNKIKNKDRYNANRNLRRKMFGHESNMANDD